MPQYVCPIVHVLEEMASNKDPKILEWSDTLDNFNVV